MAIVFKININKIVIQTNSKFSDDFLQNFYNLKRSKRTLAPFFIAVGKPTWLQKVD